VVHTSPILPPDQRPDWDRLKPMPESRISDRHPTIVGHRGAQGLAPENTLPAFQVVLDLRADGVEFDVQRTRDGHLIVTHDENLKRITGRDALIQDLTLDEIKMLDAGSFFSADFRGTPIPTLREVFDLLKPSDLLLFVELKDPWRYPGMEAEVAALIHDYDLVERAQVRSFYHAALHTLYHVDPTISLSALWFERLPGDADVTFKTIDALHSLLTADNIAAMHRRGQQVTAWTVDDLAEAQRLIDAGIDSLTTNYPDRLLMLLK
jgi:glycerophosphoryl diester phosphodiesterase